MLQKYWPDDFMCGQLDLVKTGILIIQETSAIAKTENTGFKLEEMKKNHKYKKYGRKLVSLGHNLFMNLSSVY